MFNLAVTCTHCGAHGYCYSQAKLFEGKVYCPCYKQFAVDQMYTIHTLRINNYVYDDE